MLFNSKFKRSIFKRLVNSIIIALLVLASFTTFFVENVRASPDEDPYQENEAPTSGSTNVSPIPALYVVCVDNDTVDKMNATWWSNSSGSWAQFGSNETGFDNDTNITQTNLNFSSSDTTYWWSVNLTDGYNNWSNVTYSFTTNYAPYQNNEAPTSGSTNVSVTPALYVVCNDNDSDVMTAYWWSNSSGPWALFGTNSSVSSSDNIIQTNSNFTQSDTWYYWSVNLTDGSNWSNMTYTLITNYAPTQSDEFPIDLSENVLVNPSMIVLCNDSDGDTMTAYWYSNSTGPWDLFGTNTSIFPGTGITQPNSNFSTEGTTYWWNVSLTDGKNWTNTTYSFTTEFQPGSPPYYVNQWQASLTPRYIINQSTGLFNFTLPRENGWDQQGLRLNSLNISFPSNYTYYSAVWTSLGNGNSSEYTTNTYSTSVNWTKSNSDGFMYNATEFFSFVVAATGGLESGTFTITAEYNNSNTQSFTMTVFITTNFTFNGSVFDINGNAMQGAVGRISVVSFGQNGPPTSLGLFTATTNSTGNFSITGIPTTTDPNEQQQGPPGGGSSSLFYQLSAVELASGTPYALNMSASLPTLPYFELTNMLNNPQMYLRQAITFEVDVIGPSWNWSTASIEGYSQKSFQVMVKDMALGFGVQENTSNANGQLFSVPANRNYSLSIFPDMSFPVSVRFNNILSTCQASGNLNQTGVIVNYYSYNDSFLINVSVNASYSQQFLNGTFNGLSEISEMRIVTYVMEDQDMVFESWALPFNLGNESGQPNDSYNLSSGNYSIALPATEASSYLMLRAYARNQSGIDYMGSYILNASGSTLNVSEYNFTMQPMLTGSGATNRSITSNNVSNQWSEEIIMNTTGFTFRLVNESGVLLSSDSSFVEIKRELNGTEYMQMVNAENGLFNVSLIQGESIVKLTIFSQQYAPVSTRISSSVLSGGATNSVNCSDGMCNITLRSFGSYDPFNQSQDFSMAIYASNSSCNIPNPPDYCDVCGGTKDESQFSPFNAILKGSTNMLISSGGVTVYYINVDLLASGPPDASFTDSSTNSSSGLEAAWQFGSQGPDIYDYVLVKIPYDPDMDEREIVVKIPVLYDNDFNVIWNQSAGNTTADINTDPALSEYRDYLNTPYEAYLNGTGVVCNSSDPYLQNGLGYKDITNHTIWLKILHFSGLGPVIYYSGGNQSYQLNESPTHGLTGVCPVPDLYVLCIDNDTSDTMNATWSSNSSGSWVIFATNTGFGNDTNITQTNSNFSSPGTTYYWRINLTDGQNWYNDTYMFTTNYAPQLSNEAPTSGLTNISRFPALYAICNDTDSDTMTAYWLSNSSGSWAQFAINASVASGTNITQTNNNFSSPSTTYYWSVNATDGCNWSNSTYSFTTGVAGLNIYVDDDADSGWYDATHVKTIQEGINNGSAGDTVYVYNGTYNENVVVNKALNIIGNSSNGTIVNGMSNTGISIEANDTIIQNFAVTNCSSAIYVRNTTFTINNVTIQNNNLYNNSNESGHVIYLWSCNNSNISSNNIYNTSMVSQKCGVYTYLSSNITIYANNIYNNDRGMQFVDSTNNIISNNNVYNNTGNFGIGLLGTSNNIFTSNYVENNSQSGFYVWDSAIDDIIYNNYISNTFNAQDEGGTVSWNITKTLGTNILGGPYLGGNYWSDYTGSDNDGDALGDTDYDIGGAGSGVDYNPLVDNASPTQTGENPADGQTNVSLTPVLNVTVDDAFDDTLTAYWYSNSSGPWVLFATNTTIDTSSGSVNIQQTNNNFSSSDTTYYWSVNVTDGSKWSNSTYSFTTNSAPTISAVSPSNNAENVSLYPSCSVTVNDNDSDTLTVYFFEQNITGAWLVNQTNSSVASGSTVVWLNYTNASSYSNVYNWSVNVTDGCNWTNATYSFTTKSQYHPDAPTGLSATASSSSAISLSWTRGDKADRTLIVRKTGGYPTSISDGTNITWDTDTMDSDTGLSASTTYYYKAWSWNSTGSEFSSTNDTASATTSSSGGSPPPPTNAAPTADAGGPYTGDVNTQITFTGSGTDSDGTIEGYRWDFETDGTYDTAWLTSTTTTHSYSSAGVYNVTLQVKDNGGATGTDTATVTISEEGAPQAPTADAGGPYTGLTSGNIVFDGSGSSDSDGTITNYTWNFGDGTTGYGVNPTHSYSTAEEFTVTLTVTDDDSLTDTDTTTANISLDSDGDGWSDEEEESYNTSSDDPNDGPVDTDGDGTPDEGSEDSKYTGDSDDDNDGLDDDIEETLGSDSKESSDVDDIVIEEEISYLVDTDGDGTYDKYYNPTTDVTTETEYTDEGKYLINTDNDTEWEYVYDPALGTVTEYSVETEKPAEEVDLLQIVSIILIIIAVIIIIIAALFKMGYLYIKEEKTKPGITPEEPEKKPEKPDEKPPKQKKK